MSRPPLTHILYVEDDPDIRMIAQIALETVGGFKLTQCSSGQEAVDMVSAGSMPDLLLLDVMMPGMDGPSTLAALRKLPATAGIPAMFMTAKVQSTEIAHYLSLGALGVVAKPFDPMQLARQVRALWECEDA